MKLAHAVVSLSLLAPATVSARAADPATKPSASEPAVFDPARHMHVAEVKPGMKGYGLSVFSGTNIERFDVEVISVLKNFNPKNDIVLIRCHGQNLEHTGSVAGMSGSPIYLRDASGHDRMIGAFAYGWPLSKDPVAGVQPIEYMLDIPLTTKSPGDGKPVADKTASASGEKPAGNATRGGGEGGRWSMNDAVANWERYSHPNRENAKALSSASSSGISARTSFDAAMQLQPLATPLMTSGLSPRVLSQIAPIFEAQGLVPLQSGGSGQLPEGMQTPTLAPGAVLAVPMLIGDMDMTAIGTTTEVLNGKVYGFGHPFNNEGPVVLPMGAGYINHVVASLSTSFKLGSMAGPAGTITADRSVGIAGRIGESPKTAPIDLRVTYADGSADEKYHFDSIAHPRFTPLLCGMAVLSALSGTNDLPQYNTVDYDIALQFSNGKTIQLSDTVANAASTDLFRFIGLPLLTAADNPFERVLVSKISGNVRVSDTPKLAQITEVNLPRSKYRPGETLKAFVESKRFRGGEDIVPVELELPKDLPDGNYQLVISDWTRYMQDEQATKPFRFTGETLDELFDALKDFTSIRQNALYLRLIRQPDGVAIGRVAMAKLPSSRRQMLLGAGRSSTSKFVSSTVRTVPTETVMQGAAEFVINIDSDPDTEIGKPASTTSTGTGKPGAGKVIAPEPVPMPMPKPAPMPNPSK